MSAETFKKIFQKAKTNLLVLVTVTAQDASDSSLSTQAQLYIQIDLALLLDIFTNRFGQIVITINDNRPLSKFIEVEAFNKATSSKFVNQIMNEQGPVENKYMAIKQNTQPGTIVAFLDAMIDSETRITSLPYTLTVASIPSTGESGPVEEVSDPTVFFVYDNVKKTVQLIRGLSENFVNRTIRFRLMDTRQLAGQENSLRKKYDFRFVEFFN